MARQAITLAFEGVEVRLLDAEAWIADRSLTLTFADDERRDFATDVSSDLPPYMLANLSPSADWMENAG